METNSIPLSLSLSHTHTLSLSLAYTSSSKDIRGNMNPNEIKPRIRRGAAKVKIAVYIFALFAFFSSGSTVSDSVT